MNSYLKISVLRSGSGGNCTLVWTDDTALIIDMGGLKIDELKESLRERKIKLISVKGILITHGHGDHLNRLSEFFSSEYKVPVFMHADTYTVALKHRYADAAGLKEKGLIKFFSSRAFNAGGLRVKPFPVLHEGNGSPGRAFGFRITVSDPGGKSLSAGYATDLGSVTDDVIKGLYGCGTIVLEANHDIDLVKNGTRYNKEWVLGPAGHLSNHDAAAAIIKLIERGSPLKNIFLAHLSSEHNTFPLAKETLNFLLNEKGIGDVVLIKTHQTKAGEILTMKF